MPAPDVRWLPEGIGGPALEDNPAAFEWTDDGFRPEPWPHAVLYELHLGTFSPSGTAVAAIDHLDHLVELGVTHVEVMPLGTYGGRWGWGYDGVYWSAPQHTYGSPNDLRAFVDACHARGLGVIVDVVYNHLGPVGADDPGFEPFLTDAHHTPWGKAINLDGPGSRVVRDRIVDDATMWIVDYHADGLRLDAIHAFVDDSPEHLLAELSRTVEGLGLDREVVLIGEDERPDALPARPRSDGGYGLTAKWADELHHAVHAYLTGERHAYYEPYGDPELIGKELASGAPWKVVSLQNHDQVGNRPFADRLHQTTSIETVLTVLPLFLLGPSVPMLFQGEEWAASTPFPYFADHHGELAGAIREGRAREFAWVAAEDGPPSFPNGLPDATAESTYRSALLRWGEIAAPEHAAVLDRYRELIALRRSLPHVFGADAPCVIDQEGAVITMRRGGSAGDRGEGPGVATVVCDLDAPRVTITGV